MIKPTDRGFEIKTDSLHLKIGIVAAIMGCGALCFFVSVLWAEHDGSLLDWLATSFVLLWLGVVFFASILSFYRYREKILIEEDGVTYCSWFAKRQLTWSEIKDYGLSYNGRSREGTNLYLLYFSAEPLVSKNEFKKKLSEDTLKIFISSNEYACFCGWVVPFCENKTNLKPFVPKDIPHFL